MDWIKARLLVEAIKRSPGGFKLSMEMIVILAICYEDCYLPGPKQVHPEAVRHFLREIG
jgi:hypothetical protein